MTGAKITHASDDDLCVQQRQLLAQISACRICRDTPRFLPALPHEPRPVIWLSRLAPIVIAGQAPGVRVHQSGIPFYDPSGNRLRQWLNVSPDTFYNRKYFAIIPMGFCFPGHDKHGGDLPPRRECAQQWHETVFQHMTQVKLVLAIGQYAQRFHIQSQRLDNLTDTVKNWQSIVQIKQPRGYHVLPLPHPSWRNNGWINKNPWFQTELIPFLQNQVEHLIINKI